MTMTTRDEKLQGLHDAQLPVAEAQALRAELTDEDQQKLAALAELKRRGKRLVVLSNSGRRAALGAAGGGAHRNVDAVGTQPRAVDVVRWNRS